MYLTTQQINQHIINAFSNRLSTGCSDAPSAKDDYSEAFDLVRRLDNESTANFDSMTRLAERIHEENHKPLVPEVEALLHSLLEARMDVQKKIMALYAKIAEVDVCE